MKRLRLVVLGTVASDPYAGMAWMHMQIAVGLRRLGHDVYYFETTSTWPYDPIRETRVMDSEYALPYLKRVAESFGLGDRWACRRSYGDKVWFGLSQTDAEEWLANADAVLNVTGSTRLAEEGLKVGRLVYLGTDPVAHEIGMSTGDSDTRSIIEEHSDFVTYGENIGTAACPVPPLPGLRGHMRQPVLLDLWEGGPPERDAFTTVCNWKQDGAIEFQGDTYYWSKDREFLKFIDLPKQIGRPVELAMGPSSMTPELCRLLTSHGWLLANAQPLTTSPWPYRDYVRGSAGEFTVAKDQNVRLKSGWFSERSACYLAAGRPVITQDTGFGRILPTGEGLFAFNTMDEILTAFDAVQSDYERQSRTATAIAQEYFRAETVLARLLKDLGL